MNDGMIGLNILLTQEGTLMNDIAGKGQQHAAFAIYENLYIQLQKNKIKFATLQFYICHWPDLFTSVA